MISVLIPWRESSPDRKRIFDWVLARCRALLPEAGISLADSGHEVFNRGASINLAAREAKGDVFLISDADTFFHADQIHAAVQLLENQQTWVLPYETYVNLDAGSTERILAGPPTASVVAEDVTADFWLKDSVSGLIVLTKEDFEAMGGYDEAFRGWGHEDRAFEAAANTLVGPCQRLPAYCYHLDHEPTMRFEQPEIGHNRLLAEEYRRVVGQRDAMKRLVNR